ncbi:MAG: ABC transporter ATP-binding protein [Actinomycetota bacterium]
MDPLTPPPAGAGALIRWALGRERRSVIVGAIVGTLWMASLAAIPVAVGAAIDRIADDASSDSVLPWALLVAAIVIGGALAGVIRHTIAVGLFSRTTWRVERLVTQRVLDDRGGSFVDTGRLLTHATTDAERIGSIADLMCRGTGAVVTMLGVGALMVANSPLLGTVVLIGVPVTLGLVLPIWPVAERRFDLQRTQLSEATSTATDTMTGIRTVRGFAAEDVARSWFSVRSSAVERSGVEVARVAGMWTAVSSAVPAVFLAVVLVIGGRLAVDGELQPGDIVAFTGLAAFLAIPFRTLAELFIVWAGGVASARRIDAVLTTAVDVESEPTVASDSGRRRTGLTFDDVTAPGLDRFDLAVARDEIVGVACADRTAVVSIARLAGRQIDPDGGAVGLGGIDVRSLTIDEVRRSIVVDDVAQPWLRPGTVRDNLDLATGGRREDESTTDGGESHLDALRVASLDELLSRLDPLDVVVGSRGLRLSGGQRQRLAVARAARADAAVLVLVDPTSALDSLTETRVADAVIDRRRGRCTLFVSTSPTLLAGCDRVAFVDGGRIAAVGPHDELLARHGRYAAVLGVVS